MRQRSPDAHPRRALVGGGLPAIAAVLLSWTLAAGAAQTAPSGLSYSSASGHSLQRQPPAGACHARGSGIYARPDARCTPGTLNPAVTQASIATTICRAGWTATVRPPELITNREKRASMEAYGDGSATSGYEYDHDVALELGGAVNDARNLWPEPDYPTRAGFYLNPKDRLERALNRRVCRGQMTLAQAQRLIATDWVAAFRLYG
ncbi:MAG TPA: hypothetical protein VII01_16540 [Solirubrobacteraceae bacterium]|jgi:hypothetical protein